MRPEELLGRKGKQADGLAKTREVKLGCVFLQTEVDEEGHPVRKDDSTSYIGSFEAAGEFRLLLRQEAQRRGMAQATKVIFIGDGAAWVWELARVNFPQAVLILDFYHAMLHLHGLVDALLLKQILARFPIGALRRRTAKQSSQSGGVGTFQSQSGIGRTVSGLTVEVVVAGDPHPSEQALNLQRTASEEFLLGSRLEGSVKLIDQRLHHRFEHLSASLQEQLAQLQLQLAQLLLSGSLSQEPFDQSDGLRLDGRLDVVAFFFRNWIEPES